MKKSSAKAENHASRSANTAPTYKLEVSSYDRTWSLVISLLILVGALVAGLVIIYFSLQLTEPVLAVPVALAQEASRSADASQGYERDLQPPGLEEVEELQLPQLPQTLSHIASAVTNNSAVLNDFSVESEDAATQGKGQGDNRRAGVGSEGNLERVPRYERWRIQYQSPESLDTYAQQLDHFGIAVAILGRDNRVHRAYSLTQSPIPKEELSRDEFTKLNQLYFSWESGRLRAADRRLLSKAGIAASGIPIQIIPAETEQLLLGLELQHAQSNRRDINDIRKTVFIVERDGIDYRFRVQEQLYL